ncbi:MAG: DeoR/GlpR family DNA-binding transcription regulator [Clostridia bacterium]|nr:DeoR/GlpR family DNA-binding transcription regulator [Clostridia bacterium]
MLVLERKRKIIEYLEKNQAAPVNGLAAELDVVPETIRRDLRELEKQGLLTRTHGGAVLNSHQKTDYPVQIRVMKNSREKEQICKYAAGYIEEGDMIFVDNSSTLIHLIKYIPDNISVTILTNSIWVLQEFAKLGKSNITMICSGGVFNKNNMSLSGTVSGKNFAHFFPTKAFVSCHGISTKQGFTDSNLLELDFKREMIKASGKVFFLLDHSKFGKLGPVRLGDINICDILITEKSPPDEVADWLYELHPGLEIIVT